MLEVVRDFQDTTNLLENDVVEREKSAEEEQE